MRLGSGTGPAQAARLSTRLAAGRHSRYTGAHLFIKTLTVLIKVLRLALGNTIVVADLLTRPRKKRRAPDAQQAVDAAAARLTLYQFRACPFCVRTRRLLHRLNVPVATRDAKNNAEHRATLLREGGKIQVPCLRIEAADGQVSWLYESKAIRGYLEQHFA